MSFLDRLRESFRPRTYPPVRSPTAAYQTPVDLYEHVINELLSDWHTDGWAHFEVDEPTEIVVQIAPPSSINTCDESVDVPRALRAVGLTALAEIAAPVDPADQTLWSLPQATSAELAQAVHAIFMHHHDLGQAYEVRAWLEA